jgi:hypothetical protein
MSETKTIRYWAFISYSRQDKKWAEWLAAALERFPIPSELRRLEWPRTLNDRRLQPVFRDQDELPAAANLDGRLREALMSSRFLIVVCSPASASSRWVNAEVAHFLENRGVEDILLLLVDGTPKSATSNEPEALPQPLLALATEPIWIDVGKNGEPKSRGVVRLAAGMLGVGFDELWRRERRRRRRLLAASIAIIGVILAGSATLFWHQEREAASRLQRQQEAAQQMLQDQQAAAEERQRQQEAAAQKALRLQQEEAERRKPQAQIQAFDRYLRTEIQKDAGIPDAEIDFDILIAEDLNGDSLLDFIVLKKNAYYCGSGGCSMDVYLAKPDNTYEEVLSLFSHTNPRTTTSSTAGFKDIVAVRFTVAGHPVWSLHQWDGGQYQLNHHAFCANVALEYCDKDSRMIIDPISVEDSEKFKVRPGSMLFSATPGTALQTKTKGGDDVEGKVRGKDWYLVQIWKGEAGFLQGAFINQQKKTKTR